MVALAPPRLLELTPWPYAMVTIPTVVAQIS